MANSYTVELSKPLAQGKAWTQSVTIENIPYNLALVKGLDELFKWCEEEVKANPDAVVTREAIDYWYDCRRSGGMQLYEIQTELANRWGIGFIIKAVEEEQPEPPTSKPSRNGKATAPPAEPAKPQSLHEMLRERLGLLQSREKQLLAQLSRTQDEYDEVRDDLRQTSELLLTLGTKGKTRRKKAVHAEAEP